MCARDTIIGPMGNYSEGDEPCSLGKVETIRTTAKALYVRLEDESEAWIPKSVVHDESEVYDEKDHRTGELVVQMWWAEANGHA